MWPKCNTSSYTFNLYQVSKAYSATHPSAVHPTMSEACRWTEIVGEQVPIRVQLTVTSNDSAQGCHELWQTLPIYFSFHTNFFAFLTPGLETEAPVS